MDPVSIIGLIAAICDVSGKPHVLGQAVKNGATERTRLQSELFGLKSALEHVALVVGELPAPQPLGAKSSANGQLTEDQSTLSRSCAS